MATARRRIAFRTPLCDRLGIDIPIFSFAHSLEVTAAVSRAGGYGVYGATHEEPHEILESARALKEMCEGRPFGLDILLPTVTVDRDDKAAADAEIPEAHRRFVEHLREKYQVPPATREHLFMKHVRSQELFAAQADAVIRSGANLFAMAVGTPADVVARARAAGQLTLSLIGSPRHAARVKATGVDLLVAQGYDAGAHTGTVGTLSLVPQVVDIVGDLPVIAAGGIATGRQIAAALAMGAQAVWTGTIWLATQEHEVDKIITDHLIAAGSEDTVISRSWSGKTLRMLRTAWSDEWSAPGAPAPLKMPYQQVLVGEIMEAVKEHRIAPLLWSAAGQSVAYVRGISSVEETMRRLVDETEQSLSRLAALRQ
ncbi:MAG: nitronate monooxygenase [Burkholderiales bacterium]|nr:nitronate monooxygenase [Burkholderiales bacterium]